MDETAQGANERRPFTWRAYNAGVLGGCASIVVVGVSIDWMLARNGVDIAVGFEALASAAFGLVFLWPGVMLAWRVGLVTLLHYLLGTSLLFLPATLLTLSVYPVFDLWVTPPEGMTHDPGEFSAFIRLLRGAVLGPVSMIAFWLVYHVILNSAPRR